MKKVLSLFIITNIIFLTNAPVFASNKTPKKPKTSQLSRAIKNGDINKVSKYLDLGADPNAVDKVHYTVWGTPIIGLAIDKKQNEILDLLLEKGASPNPSTKLLQNVKTQQYQQIETNLNRLFA